MIVTISDETRTISTCRNTRSGVCTVGYEVSVRRGEECRLCEVCKNDLQGGILTFIICSN